MSAKSERLLNLLIMLLVQRRPVPKQRIRAALYPQAGAESFDKMFERDKDELRALGVPVEVASIDPLFDEPGYLVRSEEFLVPDLELEPDEAAILAVAGRVWQHARLSGDTRAGLQKLAALGVSIDEQALDVALPQLIAEEPAFESFWDASQQRIPVRFGYTRPDGDHQERQVEPWGVVRSSGRWYLVGWDRVRGAQRTFRLSRVQGHPVAIGAAGSYQVPVDADLRAVADHLSPRPEDVQARVWVRPGKGHQLRRHAISLTEGVVGADGTGWDELVLRTPGRRVIDSVLLMGPDAVLLEPAELRNELVARLHTQEASGQEASGDQVGGHDPREGGHR